MTQAPFTAPDGVMDFTPSEIRFTIYGEQYYARPDLDAKAMRRADALMSNLDGDVPVPEQLAILDKVLRLLLTGESYGRFSAKAGLTEAAGDPDDPEEDDDADEERPEPIGLRTLVRLLNWLVEQYGERPTEASGSSSAGSGAPVSGTRSTGGAQRAVSTSGHSRRRVS